MQDTRTIIEARLAGEDDTLDLGRLFGQLSEPGLVVALEGDLGCGKTTLVRGIAEALCIEGNACSPTYTLMQTHGGGRLPLVHFDAWMEGREKALLADGADEFLQSDGISVVEWASRVEEWLPADRVAVALHHETLDSRRVVIEFLGGAGRAQAQLLGALRDTFGPHPGPSGNPSGNPSGGRDAGPGHQEGPTGGADSPHSE